MHATDDDRIPQEESRGRSKYVLILIIVLSLIAFGVYLFQPQEKPGPKIPVPSESQTVEPTEPLPTIPEVVITTTEEPDFILPSLDESDSAFRSQLIEMTSELAPWLQMEELIRRSVTFNDGLSRGKLLTKLVSLPPPEGKFIATKSEDGVYLTEENYKRYGAVSKVLTTIEPNTLIEIFHLFRPLFQQAYGELGYKPSDFGTSVIYSMNEILATPIIEEPIALEKTSFLYQFADPDLEKLSPLQKQLLRMGPETTRQIKEMVLIIKTELLKNQ